MNYFRKLKVKQGDFQGLLGKLNEKKKESRMLANGKQMAGKAHMKKHEKRKEHSPLAIKGLERFAQEESKEKKHQKHEKSEKRKEHKKVACKMCGKTHEKGKHEKKEEKHEKKHEKRKSFPQPFDRKGPMKEHKKRKEVKKK